MIDYLVSARSGRGGGCAAPRNGDDATIRLMPEDVEAPSMSSVAIRSVLAGSLEFLTHYAPQDVLQRLAPPSHMIAKGRVDQCLIVAATRLMDLSLEPSKKIVVESNSYPRFPRPYICERSTSGFA